jgi:hypothetical protein
MAKTLTQVKHNGKTITIMDYTNCDRKELLRRVDEVLAWVAKQPKGSLLTLTDVTGQHFDSETLDAFKRLASHNKPYAKATAVVGITGLLKIAYQAVAAFSGRTMPVKPSREEALEWLSTQ